MSATQAQKDELRGKLADTKANYFTDAQLAVLIERYPVDDDDGNEPDDDGWTETYDLNAAAGDGWDEKVMAISDSSFDFSADGATYSRSQRLEAYRRNASYYRSRSCAETVLPAKAPREQAPEEGQPFNAAAEDD
jgi:hypothetical protein